MADDLFLSLMIKSNKVKHRCKDRINKENQSFNIKIILPIQCFLYKNGIGCSPDPVFPSLYKEKSGLAMRDYH